MAARILGLGASSFLVVSAVYYGPAAKCSTPCVSFTITPSEPSKTGCTTESWSVCLIHKTSAEDPSCPAAGSDPNWPTQPSCHTMMSGTTLKYKMPKPADTPCQANRLAYNVPMAGTPSCGATFACCPVKDPVDSCEGLMRAFGDDCQWEITTPKTGCGCPANAVTPPPPTPVLPSETCSTPCMDVTVTPQEGKYSTLLDKGCGITKWQICRKYKFSDTVPGCPALGSNAWPVSECFNADPGVTKTFAYYAPHGQCSGSIPGKFVTTLPVNKDKCMAHAKCCSIDAKNPGLGCTGIVRQVGDYCEWDVTLPSGDCGCPTYAPGPHQIWPSSSCQSPCLDITVSRIEGEACPKFWKVCLKYKYSDEVPGCPAKTDPMFQPQTTCWDAPVGQKFPVELHSSIGGCVKSGPVGIRTTSPTRGTRMCSATTSCCAASANNPTCNLNSQRNGEWCRWEVDIPDAACSCKTESTSATTAATTASTTAATTASVSTASTTASTSRLGGAGGGGIESMPANGKKASLDPLALASTSLLSALPSSTWAAVFAVSLAAGGAVAAAWRRGGRGAQVQLNEGAHFLAAQPAGEE